MFSFKFKRPSPTFFHILIFIVLQFIWVLLLGLWIYWYISNYILLDQIGDAPDFGVISGNLNIITLVSGLVLLVFLSVGMSWIFIYLNRQLNVTQLYDNFISNVTHELKSPLSSIQMFIETMLKRDIDTTRQKEFLALMQQDTERLGNLINSILYLSSLENQRLSKAVSRTFNVYDADSFFKGIFREISNDFKIDKTTLTVEGTLSGECVADKTWLKIVFSNLVDNALKYSVKDTRIDIRLEKDLKYFQVHVTDNGIGIKFRDQKKIFNKFQRLYNSESPNVKGTGLGLYWVKEIVKHHGGKVTLESGGIGKGSTFKVMIPVYKTHKRRFINRLLKRTLKQSER